MNSSSLNFQPISDRQKPIGPTQKSDHGSSSGTPAPANTISISDRLKRYPKRDRLKPLAESVHEPIHI